MTKLKKYKVELVRVSDSRIIRTKIIKAVDADTAEYIFEQKMEIYYGYKEIHSGKYKIYTEIFV